MTEKKWLESIIFLSFFGNRISFFVIFLGTGLSFFLSFFDGVVAGLPEFRDTRISNLSVNLAKTTKYVYQKSKKFKVTNLKLFTPRGKE